MGKTPLRAKVEQMLTEARVLIPGAQALLGFQMAIMLTSGSKAARELAIDAVDGAHSAASIVPRVVALSEPQ